VIKDKLVAAAREEIIAQQRKNGIKEEQVMPDGRQFVNVAEFDGTTVVEAMFDKTTPNTIGTREWLNYRIWVDGELVMDVQPGNQEQYAARIVSISPSQNRLEFGIENITPKQVGDLVCTALVPLYSDDEGAQRSTDRNLPQRVKDFLNSDYAELLTSQAQELESGEATLVDGKYFRPDEPDQDPAKLPAP
jgi:hypothetical protein